MNKTTTAKETTMDTNPINPKMEMIQIIDLFNERFQMLAELDRVDSDEAMSIKANMELRKEIVNELAKIKKVIDAVYEAQNN